MKISALRTGTAALCAALGLASIFPYLSRMGYRITDVELLLISGTITAIFGLAGAAMALVPPIVRSIQFVLLFWIVDFYFSPSSILAAAVAAIVVGGLLSRFSRQIEVQLLIFSIGFSFVMGLSAWRPFLSGAPSNATSGRPDLPPIVHLILDEFMSPEAIASVKGGEALSQQINKDYVARGFRIMQSTRSESGWSPEAIGRAFSLDQIRPVFPKELEQHDDQHYELPSNAYFESLVRAGYAVEVIQSNYLNLCKNATADCRYYSFSDYGHALARFGDQIGERVTIALDMVYLHTTLYSGVTRVEPAAWIARQFSTREVIGELSRSVAVLDVFDKSRATMSASSRHGKALVVHLLFPHFPWVLDAECLLLPSEKRSVPRWKHELLARISGAASSRDSFSYFRQAECAHRKTMKVVDEIQKMTPLGSAYIIIHGDHGARLENQISNASEEILRDPAPNTTLDTLFAVSGSGFEAGIDSERKLLPKRFSETIKWIIAKNPEP